MGCNCKTVKKIDERVNANGKEYNKVGIIGFFNKFTNGAVNVINKILICLLIICLVPITIGIILFNYIFKNEAYVSLPTKFLKRNKK